ncbi:PAS domain-containing protein [Roseovarius sp. MS2]|uniref:PAS domain-containing protein n=1 Tax=Roseovarius sp. MS2 TaxID=3390728 RepID=UPI003EDC2BB9
MQDDRTISCFPGVTAVDRLHAADLQALHSYWVGLCEGAEVPRRSDINPRHIGGLLSNAFIVERIAPGVTRLRVAGLHLNALMGMEVRGMPLSSLITPAARETFALALVDLFERPARLDIDLHAKAGLGRPEMTGRLLLWPLRSDLGDVSRALGCLVTQGDIGRASRRFEMTSVRVLPLDDTAQPAAKPIEPLPGGLRGEWPVRGAARGRAHLRVVK